MGETDQKWGDLPTSDPFLASVHSLWPLATFLATAISNFATPIFAPISVLSEESVDHLGVLFLRRLNDLPVEPDNLNRHPNQFFEQR
jgi:hypothetical protein